MQCNFGCIWCDHVFEVLVAHYRPSCTTKVHHEGRRPLIIFKRPPLGIVTHEIDTFPLTHLMSLSKVNLRNWNKETLRKDIREKTRWRCICRLACLKSGIWLIQNESPYSRSAIAECRAISNIIFYWRDMTWLWPCGPQQFQPQVLFSITLVNYIVTVSHEPLRTLYMSDNSIWEGLLFSGIYSEYMSHSSIRKSAAKNLTSLQRWRLGLSLV